jgi:hypothetical protein
MGGIMPDLSDTISMSRIAEWGLKGIIVLLLTVVGYFLQQAYGTFNATRDTLSLFQTTVLSEIRGISGHIDTVATRLVSHEATDDMARKTQSQAIRSFEERLLTIERSHPEADLRFNIPSKRP